MGVQSGQLEGPEDQLVALRRVGILTCLNRLIDVYESIWSKGVAKQQDSRETEEYRRAMVAMKQSMDSDKCIKCLMPGKNLCARCKKVKYCSRECQVAHWKLGHKKVCIQSEVKEVSRKDELKQKLEQAKKKAAGKADAIAPRIRGT